MKQSTIAALLMIVAFTLAPGGCRREPAAVTATAEETPAPISDPVVVTPEQLGRIGAAIRKEPGRSDEILNENGFTRESFEEAIRKVTENADESRRYSEAFREASK